MTLESYVAKHFKTSDLSPGESCISGEFHLRFELGGELKNGSRERVSQSLSRAITIFEKYFEPGDDVDLLIQSFQYADGITELYAPGTGYLESVIEDFALLDVVDRFEVVEESDDTTHEEGVAKSPGFATKCIQRTVSAKLSNIQYKRILEALINLEMGFEPCISDRVYFINRRNHVAFHLYDDRGCLLFSDLRDELRKAYDEFNGWLVDYHRATFDKMFSLK